MAEILRRALGLLAGNGASKALLLGAELYLAKELGAGSYGRFAVCLALLLVAGQVALLGLDFGVVRFLAAYQEERRRDKIASLLRWSLGMVAMAGTAAGAAVVVGADGLARGVFGKPELAAGLMLVGFAIPFEAVNQCIAAVFRGARRVPEQVLVSDLMRNLVLVAALVLTPTAAVSLELLSVVLLAGTVASFVAGVIALRRHFTAMPATGSGVRVAREVLAFSWPLFVWNIFQKLAGRVQILLAAMFLGVAEVGILALMFRIVLVFTFVQTATNHAAPVEFARLSHLQQGPALQGLFQRLSQVLLAVAIALALPIVMGPALVLNAFGGAYPSAAGLLVALVLVQVVNVGSGPVGHLLINTGHQRLLVLVALGGSIIQLAASLSLMQAYGLRGAVAAEVATGLFMTLARQTLAYRLLGIHAFTRRFLVLVGIGALSAAAGLAGSSLGGPGVSYAGGLAVALTVYAVLLRTVFLRDPAIRREIEGAVRALGRRTSRTPADLVSATTLRRP